MKIFIDSAKLKEIEEAYSYGVLDGVTTNPSLIKIAYDGMKANGVKTSFGEYIKSILLAAKGTPVSLEVTGFRYGEMVSQAKELFRKFNPFAKNVYIKIPVNPSFEGETGMEHDGLKAIRTLSGLGIPVNCTLIFTPEQALMAAKAGARIVSPFAGRIDDHIRKSSKMPFGKSDYFPADGWRTREGLLEDNGIVSGVDLVRKTVEIFRKYNIRTEVLAASIRNGRQARECALAGADIATLPLGVIKDLLTHYKTMEGMRCFKNDAIPEYESLTRNGRES